MPIPEAVSEETHFVKMAVSTLTVSKNATDVEKCTRGMSCKKDKTINNKDICKVRNNRSEKENNMDINKVVFTKEELLVEPFVILTDDNHRSTGKHNNSRRLHSNSNNSDDLVCVNDGHSIVTEAFAVQQASEWLSECPMQTLCILHNRVIPILSSYMVDYAGIPSFLQSWWMHNENNNITKENKQESKMNSTKKNNVNSKEAEDNISDSNESELLLAPPPLTFHSFLANFIAITDRHCACEGKTISICSNSNNEEHRDYIVYSVLPSGRDEPVAHITPVNLSYGTESVVKVLMREINKEEINETNVKTMTAASLHDKDQAEQEEEEKEYSEPEEEEIMENAKIDLVAVQDENDAMDYLEENYQDVLSEVVHWSKFFEFFFDPLREGVCRDPLQLFTSIVLATRIAHNKHEVKLQSTLQLQAEQSWKSISLSEKQNNNKNMESVIQHSRTCNACEWVEQNYVNTLHNYMSTHYSTNSKKLVSQCKNKCKTKTSSTQGINSCKRRTETHFCSSTAALVLYIEYFLTLFKSAQPMRAKELNSIIESLPKISTPWCQPDKLIRDKTAVRIISDPFVNYDLFLYKSKGKRMQPVRQNITETMESNHNGNLQRHDKEEENEEIQEEEEEEEEEEEYDEEEEKMRMTHEQEVQQIKEQLQQLEKDTLTSAEVFFIRDWITQVAKDEELLLQQEENEKCVNGVNVRSNTNKNKKERSKRNRLLSVPLTCVTSGPVKQVGFDLQSIIDATEHITHWVNSCVSSHTPLYVYELLHILREELPFVAEYNRLIREDN